MATFSSYRQKIALDRRKLFTSFISVLFLSMLLSTHTQAATNTVSVIVHYPNGHVVEYQMQNAYSPEMIDKIFTSKLRSWPNGLPIQAFILPVNNPIHREFVHKYLNTNVYQIQRIWNRLIFSGRGIAPIELKNEEEMIQHVYQTPGAVGYISTRNLYRLSQPSILKESN